MAESGSISVKQYDVCEITLKGSRSDAHVFSARMGVTVKHAGGAGLRIPAFYDGDQVWRVRFSPPVLGEWTVEGFADEGTVSVSASHVECVPNDDTHAHGRLQVDPDHAHRFCYADGTAAVPLGFEWNWMSAYHQQHSEARPDQPNPTFDEALDMIQAGGFNYIVANLYADYYHKTPVTDETKPYLYQHPRLYPFGGTNDAPDHSVLNLTFFQDLDRAVAALQQRHIILHLMIQVQNKKVNWPEPGSAEDDQFWRYIAARYQAYPNIVWDLSKESYNLLKRTGSHAYALSRVALIREADAHGNLVTAHDTERESWGRSTELDDACDFITDQVKFSGTVEGWQLASTLKLNREAVRRWRNVEKPYLNVEYGYEEGEPPHVAPIPKMTVSGETMLDWTWALIVGGANANYYYCNTSWDLCRFDLTPKSWTWFGYLRGFLNDIDLQGMVPDNDYVTRGLCSSDQGQAFLVYLPEGGNTRIDLSLAGDVSLKAVWMNTWSGERAESSVEEKGFSVELVNPLSSANGPSIVHVRKA